MKTLTVIVPIYNEASLLERVLRHLFASPCPLPREWILVDDCSTDGSSEILERLQPELNFKLLKLPRNRGKGFAIRQAIDVSTGDYTLIQDADFEYDPLDIPSLIEPLEANLADVVFGSRFKKNAPQVHRTYHYFVNRSLTLLSNLFAGIYLTDMETCYKVFRSDLLKSMNLISQRFGIEVELTAYIAKTSARIFELPIHYYPRTTLQGKKINWRDGIAALYHLLYFNFVVDPQRAFTNLPQKYQAPRVGILN